MTDRWYFLDYDWRADAWAECDCPRAVVLRLARAAGQGEEVFSYDGGVIAATVRAATLADAVRRAEALTQRWYATDDV